MATERYELNKSLCYDGVNGDAGGFSVRIVVPTSLLFVSERPRPKNGEKPAYLAPPPL